MTQVKNCERTPPMKVADSKRVGSETPNTATHVLNFGWPIPSDHYSRDDNQKKD